MLVLGTGRRLRRPFLLGSCAVVLAAMAMLVAACVGDDPQVGGLGSGENADGSVPGQGNSDGGGTSDGGDPCVSATCADPSTLAKCDGTTEACGFGCDRTGGAHCKQVYPSGLVLASDLTTAGATAVTIAQSTRFVTDTGEIENLRAANVDPLQMEVKDGIGFRLASDPSGNKLAVWTFTSLTVPEGLTIRFSSTNPAALVAAKTVTIAGIVDARGYGGLVACGDNATPGPGGFAGGANGAAGMGPGAGQLGATGAGAGGGGHAAIGGKGGPAFNTTLTGGDGGASYGGPTLVPLAGGSGGAGSPQAKGGGGGGAIQIVAVESITITIGGGAALGGINAGGCQGGNGGFGSTGGAGGSGGAILLETRTLTMLGNGRIAATGGGGAATAPTPGQLEFGGTGGSQTGNYGFGGLGGSGTSTNSGGGGGSAQSGGAGGGAAGRIRINNRTGRFTPPPNTIYPQLGQSTNPAATIGTLDVR